MVTSQTPSAAAQTAPAVDETKLLTLLDAAAAQPGVSCCSGGTCSIG